MTPEGHTLSAWITFSAYRDGDATVAQGQALGRLGGNRLNDGFWRDTMADVALAMGAPITRRG